MFYFKQEKERRLTESTAKKVTTFGKPDIGGPFTLVDADGIPRTLADFRGKYLLMYFAICIAIYLAIC